MAFKFIFQISNYLNYLTHETMKLLGSTERKITKDKNIENMPNLKFAEIILIYLNPVKTISTYLIVHIFNK